MAIDDYDRLRKKFTGDNEQGGLKGTRDMRLRRILDAGLQSTVDPAAYPADQLVDYSKLDTDEGREAFNTAVRTAATKEIGTYFKNKDNAYTTGDEDLNRLRLDQQARGYLGFSISDHERLVENSKGKFSFEASMQATQEARDNNSQMLEATANAMIKYPADVDEVITKIGYTGRVNKDKIRDANDLVEMLRQHRKLSPEQFGEYMKPYVIPGLPPALPPTTP